MVGGKISPSGVSPKWVKSNRRRDRKKEERNSIQRTQATWGNCLQEMSLAKYNDLLVSPITFKCLEYQF